jgi:transcriptional regulator with XRE-family HTH domain
MDVTTANIRFLLWRMQVSRYEWASLLAEVLGGDSTRATELLSGKGLPLTAAEDALVVKALKAGAGKSLLKEDLLQSEGTNILSENIRHLIGELPFGEKKEFASAIGVDATTVSRWNNGGYAPTKGKLGDVVDYFGIPSDVDIKTDPIFLSTEPLTETQCREWLKEQIDRIEKKSLREIMPALKRLLSKE